MIQDVGHANARTEIIRAIGAIPHGERDRILEREMPLILSIADDWTRALMVGVVDKIPPGEREDVFKYVEPLIQGIEYENKIAVLKAIYDISPAEREDVSKWAKLLINDDTDGPTRAKILCLVAAIPRDERAKVYNNVRFIRGSANSVNPELLLYVFFHFAPENRSEVVNAIFQDLTKLQLSASGVIDWVFKARPHLVAPTHEYLFAKLQNLDAHPRVLRALALNIWINSGAFRLYDQDLPLPQLALRMRILTEESNDTKNPFNLYAKLKGIAAEAVPVFKTPEQEIGGTAVSLDSAVFQARANEQKKVAFADLPPGIGEDTLNRHFNALHARLSAMDAPGAVAAAKYIQDANGISFAALRSNFTEDDMIRSLVGVQGAAGDPVPLSAARFFAIMKFISDQSDQIAPGEILSPREDVLLKISASIQNCAAGKADGINKAYTCLLPRAYRYEEQAQAEGTINSGSYLREAVQGELQAMLTVDNAMMRELTEAPGPGEIPQLSHQSLYLKNLIGRAIGIVHPLTFDDHSFTLFDPLVARSVDDTLSIFYKHFTPEVLIDALQRHVNQNIRAKPSRASTRT